MARTDKITRYERQLLAALYAARGLAIMTPADILSAYPVTFEGRSPQGIHQTAASLVRKGMAEKIHDEFNGGHVVGYRIRPAGAEALR